MSRYLAGWNLPGCLPEMEPIAFDTLAEAERFIADEQSDWCHDPCHNERCRADCPACIEECDPDDPYIYWIEPIAEGAQV